MRDEDLSLSTRTIRRNVALDVVARREDGSCLAVVITDISKDGCQLRSSSEFEVGETLVVKHEVLGELPGQVRWVGAGRLGLKFSRPL
jgi:PilZ domain